MASIRRLNALGQMRVDVPHLRMIESGVAHDFDVLAGKMMAGQRPLVVSGLTVLSTGMIGAAATTLRVSVAGALMLHYGATDNGTLFEISSDQAQEQLEPGNSRLVGSWVASAVNYVGLDLQMSAEADTSDSVKFLDPDTDSEINKTVPLGRTLDYKFILSTMPFSSRSTVLPLAQVTLDSTGAITAIVDAREMMFRLGSGGDSPDQSPYAWPEARVEAYGGDPFAGGDKGITDLKSWADAVMTRVWEQGGGPDWYSATADRNVTMIWTGSPFSNGENFEWSGTNLHWKGLTFLFDNTPGYFNTITNVTVDTPGTTNLADGECLYVDLNRNTNATLSAAKAAMVTLGPGTVPGARWIIAWRSGANIYTRNWRYAVGQTFTAATTSSLGVVQLNQTPGSAPNPVVVSIMAAGRIQVAATSGDTDAATFTGFGSGAGVRGISVIPAAGAFSADNAGHVGIGANGVAGGAAHRQLGRPGVTGRGGTGTIGGSGGYSFGGAGNAALNANSIGGIGHYSEGGAGVGTGLGAEAYQGVGGLDGSGTIRQPSFVAPIPGSGPNPTVAYKAYVGAVEIERGDTFRFGPTSKIGSIILLGSDFEADTTTANVAKFFAEYGGSFTPGWYSLAAATTYINCPVRLPRGAIITGAYVYTVNNHATLPYNVTVTIRRDNFLGYGVPMTATNIYNGVAVATPALTGPVWTTVGAPAAAQTGLGAGTATDTVVWCKVLLPQTAADQNIFFLGISINYTYTIVDFLS